MLDILVARNAQQMANLKRRTTIKELTEGIPAEFGSIVYYARNLAFEQRPDYGHLRSLLTKVMIEHDIVFDHNYSFFD